MVPWLRNSWGSGGCNPDVADDSECRSNELGSSTVAHFDRCYRRPCWIGDLCFVGVAMSVNADDGINEFRQTGHDLFPFRASVTVSAGLDGDHAAAHL